MDLISVALPACIPPLVAHAGTCRPYPQAYAMTGHRSQGATLHGDIIIDVRSAFAPGLLYVMLGRVCSRKQLIIVGDLEPSMFKPIHIDF